MATGPTRQQAPEPFDVVAASDGEAMRRHGAGVISIARGERGLQEGLHRRDKRLPWIVEQQDATAPQQVRETGLMRRVGEIADTSASRHVAARRHSRAR